MPDWAIGLIGVLFGDKMCEGIMKRLALLIAVGLCLQLTFSSSVQSAP